MTIFLLLFVLLLNSLSQATVFSSSLKTCQDQCADRNLALPLGRGELSWSAEAIGACGYSCAIKSCHHGCRDLDEPISRCHARCSEEGIIFESCAQGCQAVEQAFLIQVQELVNSVTGSGEQVAGGVHLIYTFPEAVSPQLQEIAAAEVQWIAHSRSKTVSVGWKWTPLPPTAFRNNSLVADVISPEEKSLYIEFRLAVFYRNRVVVSHPVIYTSPNIDVPVLLEVTHQRQMSNDKVAVCWKINRENARVKLVVTSLDGTELQTVESNQKCHLLRNLTSENCCSVSFTDITLPDQVNPATNSTTLDIKRIEDPLVVMNEIQTPKLVMVNGSHLLQMRNIDDYVVSDEPIVVPFTIAEEDSLTAACGISPSEVIVGSSQGGLWRVAMEFNETQIESDVSQLRDCNEERNRIWQIVYDSINNFIYAVLGDKGILRCPLEKGNCTLAPNTDTLNPVRQIAVDAINGYLYFVGADHQAYKTSLFPFNTEKTYTLLNIIALTEISSVSSIFFDWTNFELYAALKNSSIIVYDVVSGEVREKRHTEYMEVTRLEVLGERLFWTREKCGDSAIDAVCFYSEDQKNSEIEKQPYFSRYLYAATINDFTFLTTPAQLFSLAPFGDVSLIASDSEGLITWIDSKPEPFTVLGHQWWNSTTELKLIQNNVATLLFGEGNNMTVTISPGIEYSLRLRRCLEDTCSSSIETKETAMAKQTSKFNFFSSTTFILDPSLVLLKKSSDSVQVLDILGRPLDMLASIGINIPINIAEPFAIDNTTLSYYAVLSDTRVSQGSLDGTTTVSFTGYSTISQLATAPSRALLFIASSYQILSFRLTGTFDHTYYSCASVSDECGQVVGLSVDDQTGEVHFALRMPKGTFVLFEANQEDRTPRLLSESAAIPEIKQLIVAQEKVVFLTKNGRVGVCDKYLENINMNLELDEVTSLLPLTPDRGTNIGAFTGEIMMSTEQKDRIMWNVEPRKIAGKTLFKVSLYKEKLGTGEKRVEVTTENGFTLPSDLLEAWSSAQKFDISVEGFTAWTAMSINKTGLQAPVKPPGVPTAVSIYATQQKTVDGARAIISIFWGPPVEWNGTPFQYLANCTKEDGSTQGGTVGSTVTHYSFAVKSGKVSCIVAASNEPSNIGSYTEAVTIDSSELKPLVKLFAIDSTNALIAITDIRTDLTIKRQKRQSAQMEYQAIAFIGNDLFAVRKEHDSVQPLLVQIDTNDMDTIVHKVSIGGDIGRIETMTSDWVANRLLFVSGMALYQLSLDPFLTTSLLNPRKLIDLSTVATDAKQLTFDPFKNIAYLLTRNGSLFSLNLWKENEQNLALAVPCLASQTVTWMMTGTNFYDLFMCIFSEFTWNRPNSPKIYALTWNGLIAVDLEENSQCNEVRIDWIKFGDKGIKGITAFAIADKLLVFVSAQEMLFYESGELTRIPITNPPLRQILAVSQSGQPFPDRSCFALPSSSGIQFTIMNEGKTGAFLDVQRPSLPTTCAGVSFPQTHYEVYFTRKNAEKVKHIRSFSDKIHVENGILDKETDYEITVAWLNRYSDVSGISDPKPFRTGFGYPSSPRELLAVSISPDTVYLYWSLPETLNAPINEIKYKVTQQGTGLSSPSTIAIQEFTDIGFAPLSTDTASCLSSPCRAKVTNLRASTEYKFWVTAIHISHLNAQFLEDAEAVSPEAASKTKDVAGTLRPDNVTGSSILLRWNSLQPELPPASISVQYKETGLSISETNWNTPVNASFDPNVPTLLLLINNLLSATSYDYRFVAAYAGSYSINGKEYSFKEDYFQGMQQIKTKAGVPTAPVNVEARIDEEGWIVSWQEPESNGGSVVLSYAVEMRINRTSEWEIAERGLGPSKMWWRPAKSNKDEKCWEFRVRAANAEGFGPYANTIAASMEEEEEGEMTTWSFMLIISALLLLALLLVCYLFRSIRSFRRKQLIRKKKVLENRNCITLEKMTGHTAPDEPLSAHMLRELKLLPIIYESDLQEIRLLAPDEKPYEVSLCNCTSAVTEEGEVIRKKLSSKAPYSLKNKLIKEAILLNNFDHPHIIKLLGVCTADIRSPYMILEYMNEGSLRDVLVNNAKAEQEHQLCLKDLIGFMIDIGRAGDYLESQRHVYRGLCAKTCFVNNENGQKIVKLGDFGLVRGMFDDSYFSSEFGDFQPIRWCAPEVCLGLQFTSKSDVWSYGVVIFELMTLGADPYPQCQTVEQVQSRLRTGDTPSRPRSCPEQICKLMRSCWSRDPDDRPSFSDLVVELETLKEMPEFHDAKPYLPSGAHYNEAFDVSIDSSSSEKQDFKDRPLFNTSQRSLDANRFDRSGNSLGGRKNSKPSLIKKREKPKPPPLPLPDEGSDFFQGLSSSFKTANDNLYNFYEQPYSASAVAGPPRSPFGSYSPFEITTGRRGFSTETESTRAEDGGHLSKSWAAGAMTLESGKYIQQNPITPTRPSPTCKFSGAVVPPPLPPSQARKGQRTQALHPSSSGTNYQQKVSRV